MIRSVYIPKGAAIAGTYTDDYVFYFYLKNGHKIGIEDKDFRGSISLKDVVENGITIYQGNIITKEESRTIAKKKKKINI